MTGRDTALARARVMKGALLLFGAPEVSIEVQDGRPASGDTWNACRPVSVFSHHIASHPTVQNPTPGLSLVKRGRPDLDGPLANGHAGVDLVYRILCLGYANHPGFGGPLTVRGPMGAYTIPKDNARAYAWGTEYEGGFTNEVWDRTYTNKRTGQSMTFREFMGRCNAGLVFGIWLINGHGRKPEVGMDLSGYHGEHKTWAPGRKPDRKDYTTDSGRRELARYAQPEDDMAAEDVWKHPLEVFGDEDPNNKVAAGTMLSQAHNRSGRAAADAARAVRLAEKNRDAVKVLAGAIEALPAATRQAIEEALAEDPTT